MIPTAANSGQGLVITEHATRTYKLDIKNKRISGFVDKLEAVRQFIYKSLSTERYSKIIYEAFGREFENLEGQDPDYVEGVIEDRVSDCLLSDERITAVQDFSFERCKDKDAWLLSFTVISIYGVIPIQDLEI